MFIPVLDLRQRLVITIRQPAQLVLTLWGRAQGVFLFFQRGPGGQKQLQNRIRDDTLEPGGEKQPYPDGGQQDKGCDFPVFLQPVLPLLEVRLQIDCAHRHAVPEDGMKDGQPRQAGNSFLLHRALGRQRNGNRPGVICCEAPSVWRVDAGSNDVGFGPQRGEDFLPGVAVVRGQGGRTVLADHLCQGGQVAGHGPPQGEPVMNAECPARHHPGRAARQHEEHLQLEADGQIAEGLHPVLLRFSALFEPAGPDRRLLAIPVQFGFLVPAALSIQVSSPEPARSR